MQKLITNPILSADFYKIGHYDMYDKGMNKLYSNLTCRNDKYASDLQQSGFYNKKVVMFGLQYIIKDFLINQKCWQPDQRQVGKMKMNIMKNSNRCIHRST